MIDLTEPMDFHAAIAALDAKDITPSALSTEERRRQADAQLDVRSFFSARVTNADLLQEFKNAVNQIVAGRSNEATQRAKLKKVLESFGYSPESGKEGSMEDLSSNARLNLILRTNTDLVRGYGQYQEGNEVVMAFPGNELIRLGYRKVPRHWLIIWDEARAALAGETSATESGSGRMIALKGDPIWLEISDFGVPWPPFKFNSGMGVVGVSWDECLDLGLVAEGQPAHSPAPLEMNHGLTASAVGIGADLLSVLVSTLGNIVLQNRSVDEVWEELTA